MAAFAFTVLDVTELSSSLISTCRAATEAEEVGATELDESVPEVIAPEVSVDMPESVAETLED